VRSPAAPLSHNSVSTPPDATDTIRLFSRNADVRHASLANSIPDGRDDVIPQTQVRAVADGLTAAGADHDRAVFYDAKHAFFCHPRPELYNERASRVAWATSLELLRCQGVY
jgi:dienelactone hydrolase